MKRATHLLFWLGFLPAFWAPADGISATSQETSTSTTQANTALITQAAPSNEINTVLMHATFRISGASKSNPGKTSFGTIFITGIPYKDNPNIAHAVMITAAHVLDDISTDDATLLVRLRHANGTYTAFLY